MKKLFIFCLILISNISLFAQWEKLEHEFLSGYDDNGLVYTGTSVIMATNTGILRSTDNGITWNTSNNGLDTSNVVIDDIVYLNDTIFVSLRSGIYYSYDDGINWQNLELTGVSHLNGWVNSIAKKG